MNCAAELLDGARAVLLDFDGPVTPLMPAPANLEAANAARAPLLARGVSLDGDIATTSDHLAVLRWTASNAVTALAEVEEQCERAEISSALTAQPTPGSAQLLVECGRAGRPVVIVSNNARTAVRAYLRKWGLETDVKAVIGRPVGRPDLMKPSAHTVYEALRILRTSPHEAVLIGDSVSDVEVSRNVGVACIGYAKTPRRGNELEQAGAAAITSSITELISR